MMITRHLLRDETGTSAIEYAVIMALIGVGLVGALNALGTETANSYSNAAVALEPAADEPAPAPTTTPPRVPGRPGGGNRVPR
ncbi:Flp family type IVb pilin [Alteriqipengyuania sp. NZ-12B]|uniref:Flp family type IVb pilin n=2 Tax=Alteriqipengyuania abyssalis TaxID=2860200 RepID=A0ABS7PE02_9SPHN|nr:Flp family type IVb pilin [Alteriqipengyuania abyssalis]